MQRQHRHRTNFLMDEQAHTTATNADGASNRFQHISRLRVLDM
jgi:hypothetical protein